MSSVSYAICQGDAALAKRPLQIHLGGASLAGRLLTPYLEGASSFVSRLLTCQPHRATRQYVSSRVTWLHIASSLVGFLLKCVPPGILWHIRKAGAEP